MNKVLNFLSLLTENNNREWFNNNKELYKEALGEYEVAVEQLIAAVGQFDEQVRFLSPKECIFRIYKDTRFSKNKEPYKTNMGAYIARGGRKSRFSGYYIHVEPGKSFFSGGIYCPEPAVLYRVREDIDLYYDDLLAIVNKPSFKAYFPELLGEKLKTTPKGYAKDNPAAEILKHKDLYVARMVGNNEVLSSSYIAEAATTFKELKPFNDFLNRAIEDLNG